MNKECYNDCEYLASYQSHLLKHIQSKQEGINYPCNDCDYQASYWSHFRNIFSQNRKVSTILAMIVIIKLHIRVIFRNTFSPNTKQEVINYPCNDCDW